MTDLFEQAPARDGFVFKDADGVEQYFMPCTFDDPLRDRALSGVLRQCRDDWFIVDTRDAS